MKKSFIILLALAGLCEQLLAQISAPVINYSPSTYTLTQGTAITSMLPINSGGMVPAQIYTTVSTYSGTAGTSGKTNGAATVATYNQPADITHDAAGDLFIADPGNGLIREITAAGVVSTLAGSGGSTAGADGTGVLAVFHAPNGIVIDPTGTFLYVADNTAIRKVVISTGVVTTVAGLNLSGTNGGSANGNGAAAGFYIATGLAFDGSGNLYIADTGNNMIRKMDASFNVTTLAGSTTAGLTDGTGAGAAFRLPRGLVYDGNGNLYLADAGNNAIRKIAVATGAVTTFAGSTAGTGGSGNGTGTGATFRGPTGISMDGGGNLYINDGTNNLLRKITPAGVVTTIAGSGTGASVDGIGTAASYFGDIASTILSSGTNEGYLYGLDFTSNTVRKTSLNGYTISPDLPLGLFFDRTTGIITGTPAISSSLKTVYTITAYNYYGSSSTTITLSVNNAGLAPKIAYSGSPYTYSILVGMTPQTPTNSAGAIPVQTYAAVTTLAGTASITGHNDATGSAASFSGPENMAIDAAGNIYLVDGSNYKIRKITSSGVVTTFAGSGTATDKDGTGTGAGFFGPNGIIIDPTGTFLYVTDNFSLRKIVISTQVVTTVAGPGSTTTNGSAATFNVPDGMAWDAKGNLYIAELNSNEIRKMDPLYNVTVFAGNGTASFVNGIGIAATFHAPYAIVNDGNGNLLVVDKNNNAIRKIVISTALVSTFAGNGTQGNNDGIGSAATFRTPKGIAMDGAGNFYISDFGNNSIREITPAGVVTTIAGSPLQTAGSLNGTGTGATFSGPYGLAIISQGAGIGNMYIVDQTTSIIREISLNGYKITPSLPTGLSFDSTIGTISGTPIVAISPNVFSITGYNYYGFSTTNFIFNANAAPTVVVTQPVCNSIATGSVTAKGAPGTTGYQLDGGTIQISGTFNGIAPGTHTVTALVITSPSSTTFTINGQIYTWTGTENSDPTVLANWMGSATPPFDGSASLNIPIVTSGNYPALTANESVYNLTIGGTPAAFNLNGFTLNTACDIINSTAGGMLTYNSNLNSGINWNGSDPTQTYTGNSAAATAALANMTVNNSAGGTITITGGPVDIYNVITMTKGNLAISSAANTLLTLKSSATQTASVATIAPGSSITGSVNVERFITGGSGYRGYRLLSSPVNISSNTTGGGNISLAYINTTTGSNPGALTGGPGGGINGFSITNLNPTMYLYNEPLATNNSTFVAGKNIGITAITSGAVNVLSGTTTQSGITIPVGNSYLFYFIGNNNSNVVSATRIPENTTITATGYLNQGNVAVSIWNKGGSNSLSFTTGTGANFAGFNQVGNPYASTINLDQVYADNYNASTNAINPNFYELAEPGQNYVSYNANTKTASAASAGKYVASGQGFMINATAANQTLTFKEGQKVSAQLTTQPLLLALQPTTRQMNAGMHLEFAKDAVTAIQTGIYFSDAWTDKFSLFEDAVDINGTGSPFLLSSFTSDGVRVAINSMGDYIFGKRVKLYVKSSTSGPYSLGLVDIKNIDTIYNVFLVDELLKDSADLRTSRYNFTINTADTTTFGANRFELAIELKALPAYKLLSFTGDKAATNIQLKWKTRNEGYYTGFSLQKQVGKQFITIDSLQGNSSGNYSYLDIDAIKGLNTYRLKQDDAAGLITYSAVVNINTASDGIICVYPNPAREDINVSINLDGTFYDIMIYNSMGALIKQTAIHTNNWEQSIASYNPGTYVIRVNDKKGNFVGKTKFVKVL